MSLYSIPPVFYSSSVLYLHCSIPPLIYTSTVYLHLILAHCCPHVGMFLLAASDDSELRNFNFPNCHCGGPSLPLAWQAREIYKYNIWRSEASSHKYQSIMRVSWPGEKMIVITDQRELPTRWQDYAGLCKNVGLRYSRVPPLDFPTSFVSTAWGQLKASNKRCLAFDVFIC